MTRLSHTLHRIVLAGAAGLLAAGAHAQTYRFDEDDEPIPTGPEIMARARQSLPAQPLRVTARMERRNDEGVVIRTLRVRLDMDWGARPPTVRLELQDAFGTPLATADLRYGPVDLDITFRTGDPPVAAPPPSLDARVFDTDFTWGDLALDFLWWPGGDMRGFQSRRGRRCFIVDLPNPTPTADLASVRLWIDAFVYAMLQAETYDGEGKPVRRLAVRSLRRVDGLWTAEDLEVSDLRRGTRTHLAVESIVSTADEDGAAPEDTAPGEEPATP